MIKYSELYEIENLIKKGFDLELISFELDIPLNEIQQLYKKMNNQKKSNYGKKVDNKE